MPSDEVKPSLDMHGSYEFTSEKIDDVVTKKSSGNYALGYQSEDGKRFFVRYVGRSDTDLNQELKANLNSKYKRFKYSYATSPKVAFQKECQNYHDFGGSERLGNKKHPDRPDRARWRCPVCNVFD